MSAHYAPNMHLSEDGNESILGAYQYLLRVVLSAPYVYIRNGTSVP